MKAASTRWPDSGGSHDAANPLESVALAALAAALALSALLWAAGELAGRLFGGSWPKAGFADMGGVLVRLPRTAGDPARAWPAAARDAIPGPVAFYAVLAVLAAPLVAAAVLVLRHRLNQATAGRPDVARWATARDLRPLAVSGPERGRLVLGRVDRRLVAAEPRQSAIVVGPTQTGKTTGLAIPAILEWNGPVVATSVKSDLLDDTIARRTALHGHVWIYDPSASSGWPGSTWTPLHGCRTWQGAQERAAWLCAAGRQGRSGLEDADFWYAAAAKLLAPLLLAAATSDRTMEDVLRWIDTEARPEVLAMLDLTDSDAAVASFEASTNREERVKSNIYATAETVVQAYADPRVLESARGSDITAARLLNGKANTLYVCAPAHEQQRLRPLFSALIQEIVAAAYESAARGGKPLDPPLLLVLDECANIAPLRDLATLASTGAGQGIQLVTVFQDLSQVIAVYGHERAPTIVSNHRAKIVLNGIADSTTIDYVGRLLGDQEVHVTSETSGADGGRSRTESMAFRHLAPSHALRQMRPGEGLLVYGHLPPAQLRLRPWFGDGRLRRLAAGEPEE